MEVAAQNASFDGLKLIAGAVGTSYFSSFWRGPVEPKTKYFLWTLQWKRAGEVADFAWYLYKFLPTDAGSAILLI